MTVPVISGPVTKQTALAILRIEMEYRRKGMKNENEKKQRKK